MLLINATKGPSQIHGLGLIAREFIAEGTRIWQLNPKFDVVLSPSDLESLSDAAKDQLLFYCYFDFERQLYILSADDERFTNHSDNPNTVDHDQDIATVAIVDIYPGEEITWSYRAMAPWHFDATHLDLLPHQYPMTHPSQKLAKK